MKTIRTKGFTLVEVLVIIVMLGLFLALIPHMLFDGNMKSRAAVAACMNNQKEINLSLHYWAGDNGNLFPWQVSTNDGGTKELVSDNQVISQFEPLVIVLKGSYPFYCPTDKVKSRPSEIGSLDETNISYFVSVDSALTNGATRILTGDRHLQAANNPVKPGLFVYSNGMQMGWTEELHDTAPNSPAGTISFVDGHVEFFSTKSATLTTVFNRQNSTGERLLVP
jgi:prepilin-type processing-associated H-X9-DG protein